MINPLRRLMKAPRSTGRLVALLLVLVCSTNAFAKPEFLDLFKKYYSPSDSSALGLAACGTCHEAGGPPKRNVYGKDLQALIRASGGSTLTLDMLKRAEGDDSDGDGWSNGDEIKKGFLPGDPSSHPAGTPPPKNSEAPAGGSKSATPTGSGSLIPDHAFHPAFIHFPIALYLFGVLLEFAGWRKKSPSLSTAALWNFSGALASMAIVAPTGVAAWLLGRHPLEGNLLIHLILAVSSLVLMILTLVTRKRLGPEHRGYLALIVITALVIGAAGHFGGQIIYG